MKNSSDLLVSSIHRLTGYLRNIAMILMALMMLFVAMDVIGRYFFNRPFKGSSDLIELMMGTAVFFGMAFCTGSNGDARVDILYTKMPLRLKSGLDCITMLATFLLYSAISWRLALRAWGYIREPFTSPTTDLLHIPYWPFLCLAAFGAAVLCLEILLSIKNSFHQFRLGEEA